MPTRPVAWGALAVSLAMHASAGVWLTATPTTTKRPAVLMIDVAYSSAVRDGLENTAGVAPDTEPMRVEPGRVASRQNVDTLERGGVGGRGVVQPVVWLMPREDAALLQDSPRNAVSGLQAQRIRTAPDRATWEDRRATPHPDVAPFLASSRGELRERLAPGRTPQPGAPSADAATRAHVGAPSEPAVEHGALPLASRGSPGALAARPRRGLPDARGERPSALGPSAFARPPIDEGPAATPSDWHGRVNDNRDAELLAASMVSSVVDASPRLGRDEVAGPGGLGGPGAPGAASAPDDRAGGRAHPVAPGAGRFGALDTGDPRYLRWHLELRRRIEGGLAFPRERQLRMDQGTSLYRVEVRRDGTLASRPRLLRSSGFDDLDQAARDAIDRALPGPPLPSGLAPALDVVPVTIPVEFWNPLVR